MVKIKLKAPRLKPLKDTGSLIKAALGATIGIVLIKKVSDLL